MKKTALILIPFILIFALCSCQKEVSATAILSEFISAYGAEGIIYSSESAEGDDGYLRVEVLSKIYLSGDRFPENWAIFLNSHADYGSECGVFVCDSADMRLSVEEMCLERIRLLSGGENSFVIRSGNIVFYSTMQDGERAERLFKKILK